MRDAKKSVGQVDPHLRDRVKKRASTFFYVLLYSIQLNYTNPVLISRVKFEQKIKSLIINQVQKCETHIGLVNYNNSSNFAKDMNKKKAEAELKCSA